MARFVTFPGTAGSYAASDSVNLLDADSAHVFQTVGFWASVPTAATGPVHAADSATFSGMAAVYTATAATGVRLRCGDSTTFGVVPVVAGQMYAFSTNVFLTVAGTVDYVVRYTDGAGVATGVSSFGAVPHAAGWAFSSNPGDTAPALSEWAYIEIRVEGNGNGDTLKIGETIAADGSTPTFIPSLRIVGDLDLRWQAAATDWSDPAETYIINAWDGSGKQQYISGTNGDGDILIFWSTTGANLESAVSTVPVPFVDGQIGYGRATLDIDNGAGNHETIFYTSSDGGVTWDMLGTVLEHAGLTSVFPGGSSLVMGSISVTTPRFTGDLYTAEVRDGIDGPIVAIFDADDIVI